MAKSESSCEKVEKIICENEIGNRENPLFGKMYRDITDIPELNGWTSLGGAVIGLSRNDDRSFRFGISLFFDDNNDRVLFFNEFVQDRRRILDTLHIGKLNDNEILTFALCRLNAERDCEIIAVAIREDKEFYDNIVRAWRANTDTGRFEKIDIEGVDCQNEGWGV